MIRIDGINLRRTSKKTGTVTINGLHMYDETGRKWYSPEMENWYDKKHKALELAVDILEKALADIIGECE